jgi:hypothetical protein
VTYDTLLPANCETSGLGLLILKKTFLKIKNEHFIFQNNLSCVLIFIFFKRGELASLSIGMVYNFELGVTFY